MLLIPFILLLLYALLMLTYRLGIGRLLGRQEAEAQGEGALLFSVVVAARNEAARLPQLLDDLKRQHLSSGRFEIIVCDDHSTDGTAAAALAAGLANLQVVPAGGNPRTSSKKGALTAGIAAARAPWIVLTDADCRVGPRWLDTLQRAALPSVQVLVGPVRYREDGSLFQRFQALDFLMLQAVTAGGIGSGLHRMANGANLAYRREAFVQAGGFTGIDRRATGDDLLLLHRLYRRHPQGVRYLAHPQAIVDTDPAPTLARFIRQRRRWASKTPAYTDYGLLAVAVLVLLLNLSFFALLVHAFLRPQLWWAPLLLLLGKAAAEALPAGPWAGFLGQRRLLPLLLPLQPLHLLYTAYVGISAQFGGYEWKGRRQS